MLMCECRPVLIDTGSPITKKQEFCDNREPHDCRIRTLNKRMSTIGTGDYIFGGLSEVSLVNFPPKHHVWQVHPSLKQYKQDKVVSSRKKAILILVLPVILERCPAHTLCEVTGISYGFLYTHLEEVPPEDVFRVILEIKELLKGV